METVLWVFWPWWVWCHPTSQAGSGLSKELRFLAQFSPLKCFHQPGSCDCWDPLTAPLTATPLGCCANCACWADPLCRGAACRRHWCACYSFLIYSIYVFKHRLPYLGAILFLSPRLWAAVISNSGERINLLPGIIVFCISKRIYSVLCVFFFFFKVLIACGRKLLNSSL